MLIPVTDRSAYYGQSFYNGSELTAWFRSKHTIVHAVRGLQVGFGNFAGAGETGPGNDITVRFAIETPRFTGHAGWWAGSRDGVIGSGALRFSDFIDLDLAAGTVIYVWNKVSKPLAADKWPQNMSLRDNSGGNGTEGMERPAGGTEYGVGTYTLLTYAGPPSVYAFGPCVIRGEVLSDDRPSVALIGDSTIAGSDDTYNDYGWARRGFGTSVPTVNCGQGGEAGTSFKNPPGRTKRMEMIEGCSHALVMYGSNDSLGADAATLQATLQSIYNTLALQGLAVYACTILPRTTSSDSWATVGNQTAEAGAATRATVNDWIRTTPSPLAGYIDTADFVESARNSGKWKAGYTSTGTHATPIVHGTMSALIDLSKFRSRGVTSAF